MVPLNQPASSQAQTFSLDESEAEQQVANRTGRRPVSIILPAYNEEAAVGAVVRELFELLQNDGCECEVIVVDDCSTDQTAEVARDAGAAVVQHETNRGYGGALKTGFRRARYECVGMLDADGTYPVERFRDLLVESESVDMAVGARLKGDVRIPWIRRPAKWFLKRLANLLTGMAIPDINSGMRVVRRNLVLDYIDILPDRFSFTTTLTLAALCDGYDVKFAPIEYHSRIGRSKVRSNDVIGFLILTIRTITYFRPLRVFLPLSLILFAVAAVKLSIDVFVFDNIEDTSVMFFLAGLQTLFVGMLADLVCFLRRRMKTRGR